MNETPRNAHEESGTPLVAVVGLGYVGLPLAAAFGRSMEVIGYDLSSTRVDECRRGIDVRGDVDAGKLEAATRLRFTDRIEDIAEADFIIVAVPTPVDEARRPDFEPLIAASRAVGGVMKRGAVVVYESTVYPGATEEVCVPELERHASMRWMEDFHVAYSPERVNPGDSEHGLENIVKIVAGDDAATRTAVARLYGEVVTAGIHEVDNIREAEAAKVIENTQRDLNIALVNELAVLFDRMGIDTGRVLKAAQTKWNFLPFKPGLVGGHCIGVDPYYLTYKAQMVGYHPEVILAGRKINDSMGSFIVGRIVKKMAQSRIDMRNARIAICGLTFKENCADLRNSKVHGIYQELAEYQPAEILIHDPIALADEVAGFYGSGPTSWDELHAVDVLVLAVAHRFYAGKPVAAFREKLSQPAVVIDVKSLFTPEDFDDPAIHYWRL